MTWKRGCWVQGMGQQEKRTNRNTVWKEIQPPCMEMYMNWKPAQGARKTECHPQELPHLHSWASGEQKTPSLRKWGIGLTCRCKWLYYCSHGNGQHGFCLWWLNSSLSGDVLSTKDMNSFLRHGLCWSSKPKIYLHFILLYTCHSFRILL